ncbi:MAG: hypothetical protein NUV75_12560 [Gallionella sp.]|nr:hypothetical protein [Gallionella sp.]
MPALRNCSQFVRISRKFSLEVGSAGGFLFLRRAPVPHGLVAAEQRGRNAAVQLDGLNGLGDRLNQCNAFQLLL